MVKRVKVTGVLFIIMASMAALLLSACGSPQPSGTSASSATSTSSVSSAASATVRASVNSVPSTAAIDAENVVTIPLEYNAGTGYQWNYTMEPEGVLTLVSHDTVDQSNNAATAGGPLSDKFTFRAEKPGEVVLTFNLARNWEAEPADTQVYAFTVSDDLKMVLNPYKSSFANEPEWGSGS